MQYLTILFLLSIVHLSSPSEIPLSSYCRFKTNNKCVAVDIWFRKYDDAKRLFPLECTRIPCPNGTICERGNKCWDEVLNDKGHEEKWVYDMWKQLE